jgi:putative PEP-CTERM system histidine kinase
MLPAGLFAGLLLTCVLAQLYLALALRPGHGVGASRLRLRIAAMGTAAWSVAVLAIGPSSELATSLSPLLSLTLAALWLWQLEPLLAWQGHGRLLRRAATWAGPLLVIGGLAGLPLISHDPSTAGRFHVGLSIAALLLCAFALFTLEQLYRNGSREAEPALRCFGLGIGLVLVVELACVALGLLHGQSSVDLWLLRGLSVAGCALALVRGTRLMPTWKQGFSLSRQVVFFASSFVVLGLYLIAMSLAGWALVRSGIDWSPWLSWTFVGGASVALAVALQARRLLPRLSVFISSHFFAQRYDYRAEWLRFSRTLVDDDEQPLPGRALRAVAQIVGSPQAQLFWRTGGGTRYERVASTAQAEATARSVAADHALPAFLARTQWLVDLAELRRRPDLYDDLRLDRAEISASADALVVPLLLGDALHGWMVLDRGEQVRELDFEDRCTTCRTSWRSSG